MARSIFDGEVTAVFQFGDTKNVLIRHGHYISVYCNLSSVRVVKGQKVKARDILGAVDNDGSGNCVLHFQLRKETVDWPVRPLFCLMRSRVLFLVPERNRQPVQ